MRAIAQKCSMLCMLVYVSDRIGMHAMRAWLFVFRRMKHAMRAWLFFCVGDEQITLG